ncbi:MAG: c-type cytochrome [Planctomycetales bacterium]|nr:c-type cytochrome [Planctomycetales bacterium]
MPSLAKNLSIRFVLATLVGLLTLLIGGALISQDKKPVEKKSEEADAADKDYAAELPRIPPTEAKDAAKTFTVAKGFKMDLVAAEPLVTDPIALAIDENLRMFVVEMNGYSENRDEKLSKIRLLDDKDGDGKYETSKIFVDNLNWPTAIACWDGGIIVADAPDILWFKDTNGDDKPDERKILFTGFGLSNVQGLINSFNWGLDNRYYCSTSSTGAEATKPSDPKFKPLPLRGRDFALDCRNMNLEPTTGGAQHGLSFDDWGNRFICSNSDHIIQVMIEDRYLARNPYLAAATPKKSIAVDGPQADVFRTSRVEPWRVVRTRLRKKGIVPGIVEGGGRDSGYFTSATGVTIYRGSAWPKEFHGLAIVGDVGSNIIHRKRLEENGLEFKAVRIDEKSELVASTDNWFRPVQYANAPDGSLLVCDMYRETIEHPASLPPAIKKYVDLTSGRDRGRIWRIVPENFIQPKLEKLGNKTTEQLVALLEDPNGWHRDTAARLIYQRQDQKAVLPLVKLATKSASPLGRIHALYALAGLNELEAEMVFANLENENAHVRQHAVRLAERFIIDSPEIRKLLTEKLPKDDSLQVRYQLALSLGEFPAAIATRNVALAELAVKDGADPYMRTAILSSAQEGAGDLLLKLRNKADFRGTVPGREMIKLLATQIGKQQDAGDVIAVLQAITKLDQEDPATFQAIIQALAAKPGSNLAKDLEQITGGKAAEVMKAVFTSALKTAADDKQPVPKRAAAVKQLATGPLADSSELLTSFLEPTQPAELQAASLGALGSFDAPEVAGLLIDRYAAMSPRLKSQAADVLFSRTSWIVALLDAIEKEAISLGDVDPARLKLLTDHGDAAVRERAKKIVAKLQVTKRGDVLAAYKPVLEMKGDAARGKEAFKKTCAACHKLEGVGFELAPNLAAMKNRGPEAILLNVLDPNREVNPQYLNYVVQLEDGRTLNGIISAETATSLTLKRADNATDTVLRIDIDRLKSTGQSLMPEGLEKQVDKQAMADLLEYFKSLE